MREASPRARSEAVPDEREDLVLQEALGRLQRHERLRLFRLERGFNPELPHDRQRSCNPGEMLREEFLVPLGLTQVVAARQLGMPRIV